MPTQKGSLAFQVIPDHDDWATRPKTYRFPKCKSGGVTVAVVKHLVGTIDVEVTGLRHEPLRFQGNSADYAAPRLQVVVTWTPNEVRLLLQGQPVGSVFG